MSRPTNFRETGGIGLPSKVAIAPWIRACSFSGNAFMDFSARAENTISYLINRVLSLSLLEPRESLDSYLTSPHQRQRCPQALPAPRQALQKAQD